LSRNRGADSGPKILVLSGPNLDRLGRREPAIYGKQTLADIHAELARVADVHGVTVECRQSNHEGALVDWIGSAADEGFVGLLFNPGAYTHTSYALYDAPQGSGLPAVEVHLSNPDAREEFRRVSLVAPACVGRVAGFGGQSYVLGLVGLLPRLTSKRERRPASARASNRALPPTSAAKRTRPAATAKRARPAKTK
jgi:3-dehydroquinate dehydratase-2